MRTPRARTGTSLVALILVLACDAERDGIKLQDIELPVPRLRAGKGVRVFRNRIDSIGQVSSAYFTIAVVGKTIDGVPIREELFVSKSGWNGYPGTDTA